LQDIRNLDNISFEDWFKSHGGSDASIKRMWDPIGEQMQMLERAYSPNSDSVTLMYVNVTPHSTPARRRVHSY
jgi:hypothetical protein